MADSSNPYIAVKSSLRILADDAGERQKPFVFHAVLFTWREADIIEACVRNLFAEGVDRVFLVDNGSPDATVEMAARGGALHMDTIVSERFSEDIKCGGVVSCVCKVLREEAPERAWWLFCDADEFPTAPGHGTIREFLAGLDDRIRVVGGHFLLHYPVTRPYYCCGFHPAEFQFCASLHDDQAIYCDLVHNKHNLIRFDHAAYDISIHAGYHGLSAHEELFEAKESLRIHHVQYRNREETLERLAALTRVDSHGASRLGDAGFHDRKGAGGNMWQYVRREAEARKMYDGELPGGLRAWTSAASHIWKARHMFARWYGESDLVAAVAAKTDDPAYTRWRLSWLMLYGDRSRYLEQFARDKDRCFAEHAYYAAQCYAGRGDAETALRAALSLSEYPASVRRPFFTPDTAVARVKKILLREAEPEIPM